MKRSAAMLTLILVLSAVAAVAKDPLPPEDRADQWVKETIGRTPDIINDPFSAPTDLILGRTPSAEMGRILHNINLALEQEDKLSKSKQKRHEACGVAAVGEAYDITDASAKSEIGRGFGSIAVDSLTASKGLAKNMAKTLGGKAMEKFTQDVLSELRKARPEDFENNYPVLGHDIEMRVVWIKSLDRYEFYINGKSKKNADKLGRWSISGHGTIVPNVIQYPDGKKEIRFKISRINPINLKIAAECPGKPGYTNDCGDPWVGVGAKTSAVGKPAPKCKPEPKSPTATVKPKPDPLRPKYKTVAIPEIPDEALCDDHLVKLGEEVSAQMLIAEDNRKAARRAARFIRIGLEENKPGFTQDMLDQAEKDLGSHDAVWKRAAKANDQVLEKFNNPAKKNDCPEDSVSEAPPKTKEVCTGGGLLATMNCVTIRIEEGG